MSLDKLNGAVGVTISNVPDEDRYHKDALFCPVETFAIIKYLESLFSLM
jgi:hypothetical protein